MLSTVEWNKNVIQVFSRWVSLQPVLSRVSHFVVFFVKLIIGDKGWEIFFFRKSTDGNTESHTLLQPTVGFAFLLYGMPFSLFSLQSWSSMEAWDLRGGGLLCRISFGPYFVLTLGLTSGLDVSLALWPIRGMGFILLLSNQNLLLRLRASLLLLMISSEPLKPHVSVYRIFIHKC